MTKYKVLKEWDGREVGQEITIDEEALTPEAAVTLTTLIEDGTLEFMAPEEIKETESPIVPDAGSNVMEQPTVEAVRIFEGKIVISDSTRELEGRTYHHIRLEDGSTQDLSNADYLTKITLK